MVADRAEDWRDSAACLNRDPEIFYPHGTDQGQEETVPIIQAKRICGNCPVRGDCLAEAIARRDAFGIWGGLTPAERRALLRRPRPALPPGAPLCAAGKHLITAATTGRDRRGGVFCRPCRGRWEEAPC